LLQEPVIKQEKLESGYLSLREISPLDTNLTLDSYGGIPRIRNWYDLDRWFGFILIVLLPSLFSLVYFGLVASDRYTSKATFLVRNTQQTAVGQLTSLISSQASSLASTGLLNIGNNESYMVSAYIESYDGMLAANKKVDLRALFGSHDFDPLSRYHGLGGQESNYSLYKYYSHMVNVSYDAKSGVTDLTVEAFLPQDASAISEALMSSAEALVNKINVRAQQNAINVAEIQLEKAQNEMNKAESNLTAFRIREQMIDPVKMSSVVINTISELVSRTVALKSQLSDIKFSAPKSQQINVLRSQISSLEKQIADEKAQLAGSDSSMSPILAEYEQLVLKRELANQIYTGSLQQLESARFDANRQHIFIERISGPTIPDYPDKPLRLAWIFGVFSLSLSCFFLLRYIVQDSRMHHGR
jgi:capsular polysaccharide transport system permease protein